MAQSTSFPLLDSEDGESVDIILREYEETDPLDLTDSALRMLKTEVNSDGERLSVSFDRDGNAVLRATQHVGIVSLPDGPTIQIRPKTKQTNLLHFLRYAHGVESVTIERETSISAGSTFIEALAALYEAELESVIRQGLHRDYRRVEETEKHLRGRLNVQKQIQKQGVAPTQFECSYEELTYDTVPNQSILFATSILTRFVRGKHLKRSLLKHRHLLRQRVTLKPTKPAALDRVELTRLNEYYADLLRLTRLVLRSIYVKEFVTGNQSSFALLIDMNQIFERAVERAVAEVTEGHTEWRAASQVTTRNLVTDGKRAISIRPDILIRDSEEQIVLVGDAKWKLGRPPNSDFYQMVSYQFAHDVPGILIYPEQGGDVETQYSVVDEYPLTLAEFPIPTTTESFSEYIDRVHNRMDEQICSLLEDS
ncbi:restriction endonuclease [Haloferax sp. MBLA0076]|uniref:Restriction endonuclease n=1 Tax=Haloferax litoreum TaxID=2666140 RepID=A0A6A8GHA9_9EURY|nr:MULTISPECIES: restriction endonuclease [Haloferax]KAB1193364.1 restriction endonuclease [Haloferax sp. CBA1148]MRX21872.1 restriction endonuclease [Haloferax litoreum]